MSDLESGPEAPQQEVPGITSAMRPQPDHGEHSYRSGGRLAGKAAIVTRADSGIGRGSVTPGPIWTPLIPATRPDEQVEGFGEQTPMGGPGQPAELAPVYVLLASDEASYVSGARIAVTGGQPIL